MAEQSIVYPEPLLALITELTSKCKAVSKSPKDHLTKARELFQYYQYITYYPKRSLVDPLLGALSQCSDHDVERKLYRTYHLILRDIFLNKHVFLQPQFASFTVDIRKGIASKSLIRSGLCWKSFGIFCNPKYRDYNSTLQSNEIFDAIIAQKEFKKQPKTLFSNASTEGDVNTSLYFSSCLASSAFHSQDVPPLTCMQNISLWCSSSYLPLARNALKLVARMTSLHPIESSSFLLTLLSSPPETVKTDALSFTLLMKAVTSLAMPIFSRLHSAEVETVYTDIMYQICTLLQTKNKNAIKITIEGLLCLARSDALLLSAASSSASALSSINTQTPPSYNLLQALNARGVNLIDFCFSILLKCLQTVSEHVADHQISLLPLLRCAAELSVMAHRCPTLVPRSAKEKSVPSLLDVVKDSSSSEPSSTSPQTHIALLRTALLELISKASSAQLPHVVTEAILALIWSAPPIFDATTRGSKGNTSAVAAPSPLTSTSDVFVSGAPRTSISGSLSTAAPGSDNSSLEKSAWDSIIAAVQEQQSTLSDDLMGSITLTLLQRLSWFTALASPSKEPAQLLRDTTLQRSISSLYSSHHVEVLLKVAENSLHTYHSMVTIQSLISVWTALLAFVEARPSASLSTQQQASSSSSSQYSSEALHARRQVLHSMFRTLDSHVEDTSMPSSELIFTSKIQSMKYLKMHIYWLLGEHAFSFGAAPSNSTPTFGCLYDSLVHEPVILRLIEAAWSEGASTRSVVISALAKIATRAEQRRAKSTGGASGNDAIAGGALQERVELELKMLGVPRLETAH